MNAKRGKRSLGAVYTPAEISQFMASLAVPPQGDSWNVLEPACADAPFLHAFVNQSGPHHCLTGVEFDEESDRTFDLPGANLIHADYLLWRTQERYDLIIGNPPYGIIGDESKYPIHGLLDAKAEYRKRFQTWHGKYNVYGAFVEQSVNLLRDNGHLVFVIPSTWMLLDDFALLRRFLAERGGLNLYYVGKAFAGVSVVAVVLHFTKAQGFGELALYDQNRVRVYEANGYKGDLICFRTPETRTFEQQSDVVMGDVFKVHFAARSPEYNKSPFVSKTLQPEMEPVLTGRNLKSGWIDYETNYSGLWIRREDAPKLRAFYATPHIVVAHTKGAKVVAAYDQRCAAWREDFHLVPKMPVDEEATVEYLNSDGVQNYVKTLYRDLTPHLTRTQLLRLPLPTSLCNTGQQRHIRQLELTGMERVVAQ